MSPAAFLALLGLALAGVGLLGHSAGVLLAGMALVGMGVVVAGFHAGRRDREEAEEIRRWLAQDEARRAAEGCDLRRERYSPPDGNGREPRFERFKGGL